MKAKVGFFVLLLALAPLTLWRAHLESSLWMDETYSLLLTTYPVDRLIELTSRDAHPPGYYLMLKAWLKTARLVGWEPGILWAQSLNMAFWLGLTVMAWLGGRRLFGPTRGALFACLIAGSAYATLMAHELRGYGLASVALFGAFLVLVDLAADEDLEPERDRSRRKRLWAAYAALATFALWMHLMSALILVLMAGSWLLLLAVRRKISRRLLGEALVAHLTSLLLFSPWLLHLSGQIGFLDRSDPQWMTPPTWENLLWVFSFWYPFGRIGEPSWEQNRILVPFGLVALALPLFFAAGSVFWRQTKRAESSEPEARENSTRAGIVAALGLSTAGLFVVSTWLIDRLGLISTFHGPRYPMLVVGIWIAGLFGSSVWAVGRRRLGEKWLVLSPAPWLLCSIYGQVVLASQEAKGGIFAFKSTDEHWPAPGETIHVMPSELVPFYRQTLDGLDVRRIEELPCVAEKQAAVLDLNPWRSLDRPRDLLARALIQRRKLASRVKKSPFPPHEASYALYSLEKVDSVVARAFCEHGLVSPLHREAAHVVSAAWPENQASREGWSYLEMGSDLEFYRWSSVKETRIVFDGSLEPGKYALHLVGYRSPRPESFVVLRGELQGSDFGFEENLGEGRFHLRLPITLSRTHSPPVLVLEHPVWATDSKKNQRHLSFALHGAWFAAESLGRDLQATSEP